MDIKDQVIEQLNKFAAKGPKQVEAIVQESPEPSYILGIVSPTSEGVGASLNLADYDRFSVALRHLEVFNKKIQLEADDIKPYLQQSAEAVVSKLTYLEEPLELLELDPVEGVAQMRSTPPQTDSDDSITYWEVFLQVSPYPHAKLARYHWSADKGDREVTVYPATFTTLGRITADLAAGLNQATLDDE